MIERLLVALVAKYVCKKTVAERVFVAVVANVAYLFCDYLVISWLWWLLLFFEGLFSCETGGRSSPHPPKNLFLGGFI